MPESELRGLRRHIVAMELTITQLEAKRKMGQNRAHPPSQPLWLCSRGLAYCLPLSAEVMLCTRTGEPDKALAAVRHLEGLARRLGPGSQAALTARSMAAVHRL